MPSRSESNAIRLPSGDSRTCRLFAVSSTIRVTRNTEPSSSPRIGDGPSEALESKNIAVPAYAADGEKARSDASVYSAGRVPSAAWGGCDATAVGIGVSVGAGTRVSGCGVEAVPTGSLRFGLAASADADSGRADGMLETNL